jgi:hypothetical protein
MLVPRRVLIGSLAASVIVGLAALALLWRGQENDRRIEAELTEAVDALRPFPRRIDDATEMLEAHAEGRRMTYVYRVTRAAPLDIEQQRARLRRVVCDAEPMRRAIRQQGVTFTYEYRAPDDAARVLGRVDISACD